MFLALSGFHAPVLRSKSPGAHSVGMFLPTGVLLRIEVPPHWFHSPAFTTGFLVGVSMFALAGIVRDATCTDSSRRVLVVFGSAGFSSAGLSAAFSSAGFSSAGFASAGFSSLISSFGMTISGETSVVVLVVPTEVVFGLAG